MEREEEKANERRQPQHVHYISIRAIYITCTSPPTCPPPYAWGGARPARLVPIAAVGMRIWATPAWS